VPVKAATRKFPCFRNSRQALRQCSKFEAGIEAVFEIRGRHSGTFSKSPKAPRISQNCLLEFLANHFCRHLRAHASSRMRHSTTSRWSWQCNPPHS
jgi:hypothetical protein